MEQQRKWTEETKNNFDTFSIPKPLKSDPQVIPRSYQTLSPAKPSFLHQGHHRKLEKEKPYFPPKFRTNTAASWDWVSRLSERGDLGVEIFSRWDMRDGSLEGILGLGEKDFVCAFRLFLFFFWRTMILMKKGSRSSSPKRHTTNFIFLYSGVPTTTTTKTKMRYSAHQQSQDTYPQSILQPSADFLNEFCYWGR